MPAPLAGLQEEAPGPLGMARGRAAPGVSAHSSPDKSAGAEGTWLHRGDPGAEAPHSEKSLRPSMGVEKRLP